MSLGLNSTPNIVVTARLIAPGEDKPLQGEGIVVRLFDIDLTGDDFLGEAVPDADGRVEFSFTHSSFNLGDWGLEDKPDFFFVVFKDGQPIFKSQVMEDIDIDMVEQFRMGRGEVVDLGTFLVKEHLS